MTGAAQCRFAMDRNPSGARAPERAFCARKGDVLE